MPLVAITVDLGGSYTKWSQRERKKIADNNHSTALVIANALFQQHKRRLYIWTSPDGQYKNQIDYVLCSHILGFPGGSDGKESACNVGDLGLIPGWEDPLEEVMATHSSILAWRIPVNRRAWWATVPGLQRVTHNWVTKHSSVYHLHSAN